MSARTVNSKILMPVKDSQVEGIRQVLNSLKSHVTDKLNSYPQSSWSIVNKIGSYCTKLQLDFINKSCTIISPQSDALLQKNVVYSARFNNDKLIDNSSILKASYIVDKPNEFVFNLTCLSDHKMVNKEYILRMHDDAAYTNIFGNAEQIIKFTDSKEVYDANPNSYYGTFEDQCELVSKLENLNFFANVDTDFLNVQ